jgi:hypothetical protein
MAEHDEWTEADDALVRRAMVSLREDVVSVPLADVRFVKARGRALRRRRFLTVGAAAAVALVVAGTVGYAVLGQDQPGPVVPATRTTGTSTPSPTTTSSLDQPGALPLLSEWTSALGLEGTAQLTPVKPFEAVECLAGEPGTKVQQEEITLEPFFQGGQVRFAISPSQDAETAAEDVANQVQGCTAGPGFKVNHLQDTDAGPLYRFTAGDAGSGWFLVVHGPRDVALLQIVENDRPASRFTPEQVEKLASIAQQRLARYGTGATPSPTGTTTPSGPKAIDEKMPVSGPGKVPSWKLFGAGSQWASKALTGGAKTNAGPGALEGSTAIVACETDEQQAAIGGQVGVTSIRTGTSDNSYLGHQRVQLDTAPDEALQKDYVEARLSEARELYAAGCTFPNGTVKSTPGPSPDTWRLDTVFTDGSTTHTEWVGVTTQATPGAVSTIVITKAADPDQAFAELDRLLNLARQK